jgi:phytoene dehydrogenase-like protein
MSRTGNRLLRQGDVLLIPVSGLPEGWVAAEEEIGERHVLADGEATGHAHVLEGERITRVEMRRPRKWASALLRSYVVIDGAATLRQTVFRPVARWNPYRTPLEGVYLCSASTPPGGGVHGMCGMSAAEVVLKERFS